MMLRCKMNKLWIIILGILLSGCQLPIILDSHGMIGKQELKLLILAVGLMLIVVIPVIFMVIIFAWKFRHTNTKAKYLPDFHHSYIIEFVVWFIPIVIIGILATITWITTHQLDPYKPIANNNRPLVIEAVALDWKWLFIYPEQNIATVNFIAIPTNQPIEFRITADAPMNGFQIPQLGTQIYAMAGMQTVVHLVADTPGDYFGRSTNYSGAGFSGMEFTARAFSVNDFNKWIADVRQSNVALTANEYEQLALPSMNNPITLYNKVQPHLYENIIMQFMMPDMNDLSVDHIDMLKNMAM
jgi:cytochrome o ubiquinol oxidase subunit 2